MRDATERMEGCTTGDSLVDAETRVEEEVDQRRRRADENRRDQRGQHRSTTLRRLVHVLRVAADGPQRRAQHQGHQRADQGPRGDAVGDRLQRRAAGQGGGRGTEGDVRRTSWWSLFQRVRPTVAGATTGGIVCENGPVLVAVAHNVISKWSPAALYGAGAGVLIVGLLIGVLINRQRGHRAIAQRLMALASRLGVEPHDDKGKVETALSYLEEATGVASTAVSESSADSSRLRQSMDSLPLGLVLCDESGGVIFRNKQAEALMTSRYGDAIAAQAVTDVLAEGWSNGVAERTVDIYGPPRRTLTIRAAVIDDGRRPLGVLAIIEDVSERRRLEDIRRDFIANVVPRTEDADGRARPARRDAAVRDRPRGRASSGRAHQQRGVPGQSDHRRPARPLAHRGRGVALARADSRGLDRRRRHRTDPHRRRTTRRQGRLRRAGGQPRRRRRSATADLGHPRAARRTPSSTPRAAAWSSITIDRIEATVTDDGESVGPLALIAIKDQGVGIPAKDLERIFERFYRVDPGRARETGGTGLGLSIVRHVAQNHGGNVLVESREGEGSTFTLELPMTH